MKINKNLYVTYVNRVYFALKNLVLPREAGSSMGQACPALRRQSSPALPEDSLQEFKSELKFKVS